MKKKRMLAWMLGALIACAGLAGCGASGNQGQPAAQGGTSQEQSAKAEEAPSGEIVSSKDSIVAAINGDPGTANPYKGSIGMVVRVCTSYLEALTSYGPNGELQNILAEDISYDDDLMGCTVKIHQGVKFHNGDELTADDIIYTYGTAVHDSATCEGYLRTVDLDNIEKVDDYTVHFNFIDKNATFGNSAANIYIVNKNTYAEESKSGESMTGTGPFRLKTWTAGTSVECERFDDYWGGPAYVKTILYRIIPEASVRMVELENNTIDMYEQAVDSDIERVSRGETKNIDAWRSSFSMNHHYFGFNVNHAPFNDERVRQAFCYAVDIPSIVDVAWGVSALPNTGLMPDNAWYSNPIEDAYEFNPEKAKELLAEAGYPDGLKITLHIDNNNYRKTVAEMLPSMLAESGIEIEVVPMEKAAYNEWRLTADEDYDLFLQNFGNLFEPGSTFRTSMLSKSQIGGQGLFNYQDLEYGRKIDELINASQATIDLEERKEIYKELTDYVCDNTILYGICDYYDVFLIRDNLKNFYYCPPIDFGKAYLE